MITSSAEAALANGAAMRMVAVAAKMNFRMRISPLWLSTPML
jgi:hypothetical protein